jgi:hypothetical protein
MTFEIDPEIAVVLPPLTDDEFEGLRRLIADGRHVEPGVVGVFPDGKRMLVDGFHRERICKELQIHFPTRDIKFNTKEEAQAWMITTQGGRRNLRREQLAYLRGKEFELKKRAVGRPREEQATQADAPAGHFDPISGSTALAVAEKHHVSPATVKRDAQFAKAIDKVAEERGIEAAQQILNGKSGQTMAEVITSAEVPTRKRRTPASHNGRALFDNATYQRHFTKLVELFDGFGKAYEVKHTTEWQDCEQLLNDYAKQFKVMHKEVLKERG